MERTPSDPDRTGDSVRVTTESEVDQFVDAHDRALLMLYTDGCGICASMEPVVGNVSRETGISAVFVNAREDPSLIERFDVRSVPTFVLFVDGEPVARLADGFVPGDELTAWIDEHTSRSAT